MVDGEGPEAIGRVAIDRRTLDGASLERLALAIGQEPGAVPPLAHWAWFLPRATDAALGDDGHAQRGGFLPDLAGLPRRMFAAADIAFEAPLRIDAEAESTTRIVDVRRRDGRSGALALVEVEQTIAQGGAVAVRERRTIVYRAAGVPVALPSGDAAGEGERWRPEAVHLFRFSAATFNAHRIHYDLAYAREMEGYPALVVHGPFTASRLAALARAERELRGFAFRAEAPLFAHQTVRLVATGSDSYAAIRCDGVVAMTARATR